MREGKRRPRPPKGGTVQINPYLNFNGNCAEAMRFYAEVLGGKDLRLMTFRDSPMADEIAAGEKDMVIHARFTVGDFTIMG
jgi:PhnB protein